MATTSSPIHVLLVEDNLGDAVLLQSELGTAYPGQFFFDVVERLSEASARLSAREFHVVLLDLGLPDSHGLETIDRVRPLAGATPILVMTGLTDEDVAMAAVRRGADDYLVKGESDPRATARAIHYALDRRAAKLALQQANAQLEQKVRERTADLEATVEVLRQSQDRLSRVLRDAPVILWAASPQGQVTFADGALEPLGLQRDAVIGQDVEVFGGDGTLRAAIAKALQEQPATTELHHGELVYEARLGPLRDAAGNVVGVLCVATDITEKRRVERELLMASEREQRRIGRDLHDTIQGHLLGIGLMLEALAREAAASGGTTIAARVGPIRDLATETLSQVRGLAKGLCPVPLKAEGLMNALQLLATTVASMFRVDCRFECPQPVLLEDVSSATNLYFIAREAVNNSIKHASSKPIVITLEQREQRVRVAVDDAGPGLPDTDQTSGSGLGLRTMQYRARMIGGELRIDRSHMGGVMVECTVPLQTTPQPPAGAGL